MSNQKCFNCGADYGLHHHETNQFPLGGYESHPGPQQWQETTFEERGQKLKELAANDMYTALKKAYKYFADPKFSWPGRNTHEGQWILAQMEIALSKSEGEKHQ